MVIIIRTIPRINRPIAVFNTDQPFPPPLYRVFSIICDNIYTPLHIQKEQQHDGQQLLQQSHKPSFHCPGGGLALGGIPIKPTFSVTTGCEFTTLSVSQEE